MLPYTIDTHFSYGYGAGVFNPQDKDDANQFWCKYSRCAREPLTFDEECKVVAGELAEHAVKLKRKLVVMLSGGMDSEVVVKSMIAAGVEFETATYVFKDSLNRHEMPFVERFVKRHGIKHTYYPIDVLSWIKHTEAEEFFEQSHCMSVGMLPHMKLMHTLWFEHNALPILGNGDVYLEQFQDGWKYVELEYMLAWYRFAIRYGVLGGIGFFQFTPEITLSMIREPKIERLGLNLDLYATKLYKTSRYIKYGIYRRIWPDLELRPKFRGNELVEGTFKQRSLELLSDRKAFYAEKFELPYSTFRDVLEP